MPARTPWSRMRTLSLSAFGTCLIFGGGTYVSSIAYTGRFTASPEFWLLVFAALGFSLLFGIAWCRDQIVEREERIIARLEDLELHIADYGDKRETSGHLTALKVTANQTGRRLGPVD